MENSKVYIILLNYNGWADMIECLESVLRVDYPNYQVIVVYNNSPNNLLITLID
jgi:GT2 family glycosyltransferase